MSSPTFRTSATEMMWGGKVMIFRYFGNFPSCLSIYFCNEVFSKLKLKLYVFTTRNLHLDCICQRTESQWGGWVSTGNRNTGNEANTILMKVGISKEEHLVQGVKQIQSWWSVHRMLRVLLLLLLLLLLPCHNFPHPSLTSSAGDRSPPVVTLRYVLGMF